MSVSDIFISSDLALRAPGLRAIPPDALIGLREALSDSAIPFLVEARDWARMPGSFHEEIERSHVVVVGGTAGIGGSRVGAGSTAPP